MRFILMALAGLSLVCSFSASAHSKKSHRHHHAHVHGAGELKIAFDQQQGKMEFKSAADSILGFEHEAKTDKDLKVLADAKERFQTKFSEMVIFAFDLGCQVTTDKVEILRDGSHADFTAHYSVLCQKSPMGSELRIDFTSFKKMNNLDVTVLVDDIQVSEKIKKKPVALQLKK